MATKTINGSYPAGYALDPAFQTLNIGAAATVGGTGVTTSAVQPSTINNRGQVKGTTNGITLSDGGAITNGSTSNTTALIYGIDPIVVDNGSATITNFALIDSSSDDYAVQLHAGGSVKNGTSTITSARIANGIEISGATGTVTNDGVIDGTFYSYEGGSDDGYTYFFSTIVDVGPSISLLNGGTITNGTNGNTVASLSNGISISGGSGKVVNGGTIGHSYASSEDRYYLYDFGFGSQSYHAARYAITLNSGGSVTNGSASNASAVINGGIGVFGGAGTIVNLGTISGNPHYESYIQEFLVSSSSGYSIGLHAGGTITNGSATNTVATITTGIDVAGSTGTITNYGTIGNDATGKPTAGTKLEAGGTIVNGSAGNSTATISGGTGIIASGSVTVTNFGTIKGTGGTAISFDSASARLIEQGSGVLDGKVAGAGGTLELAGKAGAGTLSGLGSTITGFATVTVDKGASWTLSGSSSVAAATTLTNSGTLTLAGQVVNSGSISNLAGATLAFGGDYSITTDPAIKSGQFTNAGLIEKLVGTGTSIIRTGSATLTSTGVIDVETGTLELTGSAISITGAIKGAGTIEFGVGATTLGDGASITTASFDIIGTGAQVTVGRILTYANDFSATSNTELTITAGDMLKLTGTASFAHDMVDGAGRLTTTGATTINDVTLGGTAQWYNAGVITETGGTLTVGDNAGHQAVFLNQATGVFNLAGNVGIGIGSATTSTFTNQGLLAKTAGGLSTISIAMVNTGTIEAASGTLDLQQAVTGMGLIKIDAGKVLQADAAVSAGQTVDFNGGGDKLVLTDAVHFAAKLQDFGAGDKLDLRQFNSATTTLGFSENAAHTAGTLTVTDGALVAKIALLGQYIASAFHTASDGVGGTYVTYTPPPAPALIAPPHS